jgi:hypothetical protein
MNLPLRATILVTLILALLVKVFTTSILIEDETELWLFMIVKVSELPASVK